MNEKLRLDRENGGRKTVWSLLSSWHIPAVTWKVHKSCGLTGFLPVFFSKSGHFEHRKVVIMDKRQGISKNLAQSWGQHIIHQVITCYDLVLAFNWKSEI